MKRLSFTWALNENVKSMEEITEDKINSQVNKLNEMLDSLKEKLLLLNGVTIDFTDIKDCNGKYSSKHHDIVDYSVNNRMDIIISKQGRKTTWNDVYKVINTIKAAKYNFI